MQLSSVGRFALLNGWLLAAVFYLVFGVLLVLFPRQVVSRLYERPAQWTSRVVRRTLGLVLFLAWLLLSILTPLKPGGVLLTTGLALYALGLTGFVVALFNFAKTPAGQPVTSGLYRLSRHPQQFTISVTFLGISLAMESWVAFLLIAIGIIAAHDKVLAEEEACLRAYGKSYSDYMNGTPRYFLVF
jgi:protein-S-isoprenylcysteine O-methyltransferase Ste14